MIWEVNLEYIKKWYAEISLDVNWRMEKMWVWLHTCTPYECGIVRDQSLPWTREQFIISL